MSDNTTTTGTSGTPASGTISVDGDPITVDRETTVGDLKAMAGITDDEKSATYVDGDDLRVLNEPDRVLDHVADGDAISFQPVEGTLFG